MKAFFFYYYVKYCFLFYAFTFFPFFKLFLNLRPKSPPGRSTDPFESRFYKRTPSPPSPHVSRSKSHSSFSLRSDRKPSADIGDLEEKALLTLREFHNKEVVLYKKNPKSHPDYIKESKIYVATKVERARVTGDITDMKQIEEEWEVYWNYRLVGLLEESWVNKREKCLAALRRGKKRADSRDSSSSSSYSSSSSTSSDSLDSHSSYEKEFRRKSLKKRSPGNSREKSRSKSSLRKRRKGRESSVSPLRSTRNFREKSKSVSPSRKRRKGRNSPIFPSKSTEHSGEKRRSASPSRERKRGRNSSPPAEHNMGNIQESLLQDIFRKAQEKENANVKGNKNQHGREEAEAGLDVCVSDLFAEIGDDVFIPPQSERTKTRGRHEESVSMPPHSERTESRGRHKDARVFSKETGSSRTDSGSHSGRRERHDDERYSRKIESSRIDYQEGEPSLLSENKDNLVSKMAAVLNHVFKGGINETIAREVLKLLPEAEMKNFKEYTISEIIKTGLMEHSMDALTKSTADEPSGKTEREKLKSADFQRHSESSHAIGAGGVLHPETGQEKNFRMSPSDSPREKLPVTVASSSESPNVKKYSHILEVLEVLNRFGDDLGSLKVPLNYVYDRTLRLHSAGHDAMSLFSDKDNMTLMFLINSRLKQVLKSPQISVIQKVIVEEALVRLNTFLESVVPVVDIKDIAFKCIGESDEVIRDSIQREIMRSFDFAATPKQIQVISLHVKEEQLEIMFRIKQRAPLSLSESSTVASPGIASDERGTPFPKEMATSRLPGSDRYAPEPEDIHTSSRDSSIDTSNMGNFSQSISEFYEEYERDTRSALPSTSSSFSPGRKHF